MKLKIKPKRDSQASEPTLDAAELRVWRDGTGKVHLIYRDATAGQVRAEVD